MEQILSKLSEIEITAKSIMDDAAYKNSASPMRWNRSSGISTSSLTKRPNIKFSRSVQTLKRKGCTA